MHKLPEKVMQYQSQIANQAESMRKYNFMLLFSFFFTTWRKPPDSYNVLIYYNIKLKILLENITCQIAQLLERPANYLPFCCHENLREFESHRLQYCSRTFLGQCAKPVQISDYVYKDFIRKTLLAALG